MPDKPAETTAPAPPKAKTKFKFKFRSMGKKKLVLMLAVVLILALGAGGAFVYVMKKRAAAAEFGTELPPEKHVQAAPPVYLPFESMVVNLADPGGEKVAQVGITLELADGHATDLVKQYLPTIRSAVLLLVSQRTSEELLQREGKEKLAIDIKREALRPLGFSVGTPGGVGAAKNEVGAKTSSAEYGSAPDELPIRRVLFSSFIVQ